MQKIQYHKCIKHTGQHPEAAGCMNKEVTM